MKLFLGRHGEASFNAPSDRQRELTPAGVRASQQLIKAHIDVMSEVNTLWASELVRARQTAGIYAEALGLTVQTREYLAPDYDAEEVLAALSKEQFAGDILIVSHQPLVGELVSLLVEGNVYDAHPYVTSEIVAMDVEHWVAGGATRLRDYRP
ncbi:MAG: phosphohistidine phosphatase SixA [Oleiphilaceae bacterium]|nr:phosphohistidine phosphatase SixA [Oleiphilaceae bacterium]